MKINITIFNEHGELLDKQFTLTLDEMRNIDMNDLVNEAEKNGEEDGLINLEDYDGSSKIDLINSNEKFQ